MDAWERFVSGQSLVQSTVPKHVLSSWQRSRRFGVEPGSCKAPLAVRVGDELEHLRLRNRDLVWAAQGIFMASAHLLAKSGSIMLLTDASGIVLESSGDARTLDAAQDIHLTNGGNWNESVVGTNGIGTALATGRPTQVHAAQHFCQGIKSWTCAASPVYLAGTDQLLGVIDISGPPATFQLNNLALAVACARQIESVLAERISREHNVLLEACLNHPGRSGAAAMVVLDRNARIVHSSGCLTPDLAARLVDGLKGRHITAWNNRLPDGLLGEWMNPVRLDGSPIGALLIVPKRSVGRILQRPDGEPAKLPAPAEATASLSECLPGMVGASAAFRSAVERARLLGRRRVSVLIQGETGAGKELFARALHEEERKGGSFVAFNCGAITKELIGSELFGHVRGAFTGATSEGRAGRFELAHGGTLCLDEVGELPLDLQPVLLRALEEGVVYRLGDTTPRPVDVRLVAMTNRDLVQEVEAGRFRRDLFHRIGVTRIQVPALREREGDVDLLVDHFVRTLSVRHGVATREIGPDVRQLMRAYAWPGNVRELRNVIESLLLTSDDEVVRREELPVELLATTDGAPASAQDADLTSLEATERLTILQAIQRVHGNLALAARVLGISRSTLYRKVERYQLDDVVKASNDGEH
ncbi:sigma-54-dependent Fis family transcriptional regulator [Methylibium sp.]|uniref:sigma-54-dependent Fis family transcriptional regulator n=1 Tax=Methylibium sp. TaxID=2067992 RepID=UPI003D0AEAAD